MKMFDYDPQAKIAERDYASTGSWTLRAPMLALSTPDPALAFPPGTQLHPRLFIRNVTGKTISATLRFNWRAGVATGKAVGPALQLAPYQTQQVDVAALQNAGALPKNANWALVTLATNSLPDEVVAVASSYDDTLRYGAQTPFNDQLTYRWEGGMWQYDAYHDSIITAGNGGTQPISARFTLFYNQGTKRYDMEQSLQPDQQMWVDVGQLIRAQSPDINGNTLPSALTSGSYEITDLSHTGAGTLFEGKVIYDKMYGHAAYGCALCCGYATASAILWYNPLGIPDGGTTPQGVQAEDMCQGGAYDDVSSAFYGSWSVNNPSIATADHYGTHTGESEGSTNSCTTGHLNSNDVHMGCPLKAFSPCGNDTVMDFTVGYNAYIPVDHVIGPTGCTWAGGQGASYIYMGDANRGTYRTAESINVQPDSKISGGFFQDTGYTRQYGYGSPANGSTLSSLDEDGVPYDCYVWNNTGKATPNFSDTVTYPQAHQGQVEFTGSASNPFETQWAAITWDMRTVINTSNASATAFVNYNHTCYPAHQIKVNGQVIYSYTPPHNDTNYIFECLGLGGINNVTGQTNAVSVPVY